ncbi:MAG: hypothetical protein RM368_14275 [Nostoc sp. DedSLP03]|uniref:hypothetical protein n=1 Tax=Nostoc sp. DedSLP03 TaxID=3075400 RepID=UPI002AD4F116|nr:hypothetical protein [Nostoc sp. DedSLP03]MDZ7966126.1 hypothetical protein [Nostoc sp. DedSLP03]
MVSNDYISQLHRIVCNSADVLPNRVAKYLKTIAASDSYKFHKVKKQILTEANTYRLLVDYIPIDFVDCVLDFLIKKQNHNSIDDTDDIELSPEEIERLKQAFNIEEEEIHLLFTQIGDSEDSEIFEDFKIVDYNAFSPPTYIHGPFLYILNKHESEGLRLIQTLVNSAVIKWRESKQGLTPLPVIINLSSGTKEFWGDEEVYCWYRDTVVTSYFIISALMALEVWMERQIEAGRSAKELFEKVLQESDCVAVLGICVSMTLAYPNKCLKAALPIITSPNVWQMDIFRLAHESSNLSRLPWEREKLVHKIIEEHNQKPHRKLDIRNLSYYYLFSDDNSFSIPFQESVSKFTENLPFKYKEEQEDSAAVAAIQEKMENYQIWGNRDNYRYRRVNKEQLAIWAEPPEDIRKRNDEKLAPNFVWQHWFKIAMWAVKTIEQGKVCEVMTLEEAVDSVKQLQKPDDFYDNNETWYYQDNKRLQAIAGVAAAILIADFEWTKAHDLIKWSSEILFAAARMPYQGYEYNNFPFDPKVSAGRGLGVLVVNSVANIDIRQQLLRLITDSQIQVVEAVFRGLFEGWTIDEVLCWNALSLGLSLCLFPKNISRFHWTEEDNSVKTVEWKEELLNKYLTNLNTNIIPDIPGIPSIEDEIIFDYNLAERVLHALPFSKLVPNPVNKERILKITDDLMSLTVNKNTPVEDERHFSNSQKPSEWNRFFIRGLSQLAQNLSFDEIRNHILIPIQKCWSETPEMTAELLNGYISFQIGYLEPLTEEAQLGWSEICNWVLDSPELAKYANSSWLSNEMEDVVQLILFSRYSTSRLIDEWPHAHLFSNIINKWVKVIGHNPDAYGHLVTMLNGLGWQFVPEQALEWLSQCVNPTINNFWQERRNGERTTELLQKMWNNFENQIRSNNAILNKYSELVYQLVDAGIPLAGVLRQKLEKK